MKQRLLLLCCTILFFYACKDTPHKDVPSSMVEKDSTITIPKDSILTTKKDPAEIVHQDSITIKNEYGIFTYKKEDYDKMAEKHHTKEDSIRIKAYMVYATVSRAEFNEIVDSHHEFFKEEVLSPMKTALKYSQRYSESDFNWYFMLYAHFLKQRYDAEKYKSEKERLAEIYLHIVELHGLGPYGRGTFHWHEKARTDAIAEYETYKLSLNGMQLMPEAEFQKAKKLFIQELWSNLNEGKKEGFGVSDQIKAGYMDGKNFYKRGEKAISAIDSLMINSYYLKTIQEIKPGFNHYQE